MNFLLEDLH